MVHLPQKTEIETAYENAPAYIKEYVVSEKLQTAFEEIRVQHKLHFDEADKLTDALVATFIELTPAASFPDLLKEVLEQNIGTYDAVLKDVNEKIFKPFRERLMEAPEASRAETRARSSEIPQRQEDARQVAPLIPLPPINPLEQRANEKPQTVSVDAFSESASEEHTDTEGAARRAVDPYREPIE